MTNGINRNTGGARDYPRATKRSKKALKNTNR